MTADAALFLVLHLGSLVLIAASAWVFGETVLRRCRLDGGRALATALGLGLMAQATFFVGLAGGLRRGIVLALLALGHLACLRTWRRVLGLRVLGRLRGIRRPDRSRLLRWATGTAILVPIIVLALYPPTGFDPTAYHLPYVKAFLEAQRLVFVPELRFPVFPQAVEMGFLLGFFLSGEIAAQLTQTLSLLLTAALIYEWGRDSFSSVAGGWAAALWLGTPLAVWVGASAFVDVGLAMYVTAAFCCQDRWRRDADRRWLWLAGAFAGFAAATKYLGLFFCGVLLGLTAVRAWKARAWRPVLAVAVAAALTLAPWYLRIVYHTGNPVFPFYASVFGESEWMSLHDRTLGAADGGMAAVAARQFERMAEGLGFLLAVPWTAVFERDVFRGQAPLSPFYLMLLPLCLPLALLGRRTRRLLAVAGLYGLFWLTTVRDLRFLLPLLPALNLALADGLVRWKALAAKQGVALAVAALLLAPGPLYAAYKIHERGRFPLTEPEREAFLASRVEGYDMIRRLNREAGEGYTVYALFGERLGYHCDGRFVGNPFGPARYSRILRALRSGRELHHELRSLGACHFLVRHRNWRVRLPEDDFFRQRFRLLGRDSDYALYELRGCVPE